MSTSRRIAFEKVTTIKFGGQRRQGIYGIFKDVKTYLNEELGWPLDGTTTLLDGQIVSDGETLIPQGTSVEFKRPSDMTGGPTKPN